MSHKLRKTSDEDERLRRISERKMAAWGRASSHAEASEITLVIEKEERGLAASEDSTDDESPPSTVPKLSL